MTTAESIISFSGTAVGGAIIGKWLNRKRDELEEQLKGQAFYKTLIADITAQRAIEHEEMEGLKSKIEELTNKVNELVNVNKDKDEVIESQRNNILRWENNCVRLEGIVKSKEKQILKLFKEIEEHESNK